MSITWIFTIISLFFCCVAAYNLKKIQKNNKNFREIKVDKLKSGLRIELINAAKDAAKDAAKEVLYKAVSSALELINTPKQEGYLITNSRDMPYRYYVWRKCSMEQGNKYFSVHYGTGYILVKSFDSDNAEENLRNATELCKMLNEGINEKV